MDASSNLAAMSLNKTDWKGKIMAAVFDTHANPFVLHGNNKCITQEIELHTTKDGEHICLGVNVYDEDGEEYVVVGLGTEHVWGYKGDSEICKQLEPKHLTREMPDSWSRLEKDISDLAETCRNYSKVLYGKSYICDISNIDCHECGAEIAADIIRRAKALAGVE